MSVWSKDGNVTLGELIEYLKTLPQDMVVADGFYRPHSYRGCYEDVAFVPKKDVPVSEMLAAAESALDETYSGWKGGVFTMHERTDCWLSDVGKLGVPVVLPDFEPTKVYRLPTEAQR